MTAYNSALHYKELYNKIIKYLRQKFVPLRRGGGVAGAGGSF